MSFSQIFVGDMAQELNEKIYSTLSTELMYIYVVYLQLFYMDWFPVSRAICSYVSISTPYKKIRRICTTFKKMKEGKVSKTDFFFDSTRQN